MTGYIKLDNALVRVIDNKEEIVGRINDPKLLNEIICLLNDEV